MLYILNETQMLISAQKQQYSVSNMEGIDMPTKKAAKKPAAKKKASGSGCCCC
jgi:hypothetical protein